MDDWIITLLLGFLALFTLLCFIYCIRIGIQTRKIMESQQKTEDTSLLVAETEEEPGLEEIYATVVNLRCEVKMVGLQTPKTVKVFTVTFETEGGETVLFKVPEEMYHGFEVGQRGVLTYVEDSLYGFDLQFE